MATIVIAGGLFGASLAMSWYWGHSMCSEFSHGPNLPPHPEGGPDPILQEVIACDEKGQPIRNDNGQYIVRDPEMYITEPQYGCEACVAPCFGRRRNATNSPEVSVQEFISRAPRPPPPRNVGHQVMPTMIPLLSHQETSSQATYINQRQYQPDKMQRQFQANEMQHQAIHHHAMHHHAMHHHHVDM